MHGFNWEYYAYTFKQWLMKCRKRWTGWNPTTKKYPSTIRNLSGSSYLTFMVILSRNFPKLAITTGSIDTFRNTESKMVAVSMSLGYTSPHFTLIHYLWNSWRWSMLVTKNSEKEYRFWKTEWSNLSIWLLTALQSKQMNWCGKIISLLVVLRDNLH